MGKEDLTQEYLKSILYYNEDTGNFTWLDTKNARQRGCVGWFAGGKASDYIRIGVNGKSHMAHRLAWLYVTGSWPEDEIDHINNVGEDNRFSNLRCCSHAENMRNFKTYSNNLLGVKGVRKRGNRYEARIQVEGKPSFLGSFKTIEEAEQVIRLAREEHHGEFCNHG